MHIFKLDPPRQSVKCLKFQNKMIPFPLIQHNTLVEATLKKSSVHNWGGPNPYKILSSDVLIFFCHVIFILFLYFSKLIFKNRSSNAFQTQNLSSITRWEHSHSAFGGLEAIPFDSATKACVFERSTSRSLHVCLLNRSVLFMHSDAQIPFYLINSTIWIFIASLTTGNACCQHYSTTTSLKNPDNPVEVEE